MLTMAKRKSLVYTCLTAQQQEAVAGLFINPPILSDDEVTVCNSYFNDPNETISKFTLASANAILYFNRDLFKILSAPKLSLHDSSFEIFIGHNGNQLFHPTPISIPAQVATAHVMMILLVSDDPFDPSSLHELGAQH
jgi:hypothetical protein